MPVECESQDVKSLGIAFDGMPPGYLDIKKIVEGGWGESVGVNLGHLLVEVNCIIYF